MTGSAMLLKVVEFRKVTVISIYRVLKRFKHVTLYFTILPQFLYSGVVMSADELFANDD